jgi:uncharacterized protein YndB with AHSA1/START domain
MAAHIQSTTSIARPVDDVFEYLLNLDLHPPTDPNVESVTRTPDGPTGPGTTLRFNHRNGKVTIMRFTAVEPGRRIGFEGKVGPLKPAGDFQLAHVGGQTTLTVRVTPNPAAPLRMLSPVVNRIGQRVWDQRLEHIKAALETLSQ